MSIYNRQATVTYAEKWALSRNPAYANFDQLGGDCTNFASQCLHAGGCSMNYAKDVGWYYHSAGDRAAAWTSASYLHNFLTHNKGRGPAAVPVSLSLLEPGDLIQLHNGKAYYHTLVVVDLTKEGPLICAHTDDSLRRPLYTYTYLSAQGLHIIPASGIGV